MKEKIQASMQEANLRKTILSAIREDGVYIVQNGSSFYTKSFHLAFRYEEENLYSIVMIDTRFDISEEPFYGTFDECYEKFHEHRVLIKERWG